MDEKTKQVSKREAQNLARVERTQNSKVYIPNVDIYEKGDETIVITDMPGVDEKSVDINIEKNVLKITGYIEPEKYKDYRLTYSEYEVGDFQRAFTLSNEIDIDKIEATVKNGVLKLTLPKSEKAKPKKIEVKAS